MRNLPFLSVFHSFCITHGIKLIPLSEKRYQFPARDTKWLKNGKLRSAILFAFYNISQRNFGILLILRCSFNLWWNFYLDLSRSKFCSLGNIGLHWWEVALENTAFVYLAKLLIKKSRSSSIISAIVEIGDLLIWQWNMRTCSVLTWITWSAQF